MRLALVLLPALLVLASACSAPVQPAPAPPPQLPTPLPISSPAWPEGSDLTLGQNAGSVLIGLTLRPALPGANTLLVYVLPLEGPAAAADVPVSLTVSGQSTPLDLCSRTCRTASVNLLGGEHLAVTAGGADGGTASFDLPPLPAPDGTALFQQVQDRMHQLQTYRVDETLGPSTPPIQAEYTFQAPDRMQVSFSSGASTIWLGPTRYSRSQAGGAWQTEPVGISLPVPSFVWDAPSGPYVGVHEIGTETVDGVPTRILAFFWTTGQTAAWFRLWADASGLVHRAAMRAQGHVMDHHYADFDAPLLVQAPPGAG